MLELQACTTTPSVHNHTFRHITSLNLHSNRNPNWGTLAPHFPLQSFLQHPSSKVKGINGLLFFHQVYSFCPDHSTSRKGKRLYTNGSVLWRGYDPKRRVRGVATLATLAPCFLFCFFFFLHAPGGPTEDLSPGQVLQRARQCRHALLPGGPSKQAPKTHVMSEEERGDWVSNGLGCANYMIREPQPHPSLWTTSSKRTMKMKYSRHHLNVQIFLHTCAWAVPFTAAELS